MVDNKLDELFHAIADGTRRAMLERLTQGQATVGELAAPFEMSLAGVSKHLKVLERAGLVRRTIRGRTHACHLNARRLRHAQAWLSKYERYWNRRLDALEAALGGNDD